jgi:hypothetical protein
MTRGNAEKALLRVMNGGGFLKSHREIDGTKQFLLHLQSGESTTIDPTVVRRLREGGLIDSNKKFPVATYWLTPAGLKKAKEKGP